MAAVDQRIGGNAAVRKVDGAVGVPAVGAQGSFGELRSAVAVALVIRR